MSVMSFVSENKDTWCLCKIHQGLGRVDEDVFFSPGRMDYHKDCHFSFVYFTASTWVTQTDWLSLRVSCARRSVLLTQRTM